MAIVSMTGFGGGNAVSRGISVDVELSSVNRKQFDFRLNLPRNLSVLESRIRKLVQGEVSRGYINGYVRVSTVKGGTASGVKVDLDAAELVLKEIRKAGRKLNLEDDITLRALLRLPDVVQNVDVADDVEAVWPVLKKALKQAVNNLVALRKSEGRELDKAIRKHLATLAVRLEGIKKLAPKVQKKYSARLRAKLKEAGINVGKNDERLHKEIFLMIDRSDITEETVRLEAHFKHADKLLSSREPVGRALDFLCQEMFREINTIGSKANDAGISGNVVKFKTELECVREQVQNVE